MRFYDPDADAWRSTWIEPINARIRHFAGRLVDGDIVLLSTAVAVEVVLVEGE